MKTRTIGILLGAILLLALVAVLADRTERSRTAQRASGRIVPDFVAAKAVRLEVKAHGKTTTLEKKDGAWKIAPESYAADEAAVTEALEKLEKMEKSELASDNAEKHGVFEVKEGDDKSLEVKAWTSDKGDPSLHVFLGKAGPDFQSSFVRVASDSKVYRTTELVRPALDRPRGFRDRTILKFAPEEVVRLDLTSEAGRWVLERPSEPAGAEWKWLEPEPGPAQGPAVDSIVRTLSTLSADEFPVAADPVPSGLSEPKARSLVVLKDGRTLDLLWGNPAEASRVFVKRADSESIWEVMDYKKNQVFPKIETLKPVATDGAGGGTDGAGAAPGVGGAPATQPMRVH